MAIVKSSLKLLLATLVLYYFFGPYTGGFSIEQKDKHKEWAVVAGASEGLGAEWGHQLAGQGLNVLLIARREQALQDVADSIRIKYPNVQVDALVLDLLTITPETISKHIQKNGDRRIGLVVVNAMYTAIGPFLGMVIFIFKIIILKCYKNIAKQLLFIIFVFSF